MNILHSIEADVAAGSSLDEAIRLVDESLRDEAVSEHEQNWPAGKPMSADAFRALFTVIVYLRRDEKKHYEQCLLDGENSPDHIYLSIKRLIDWMDAN